ncbi:GNAT family N-acetyltransferase [Marinoscillum sp. MHG1-6]|uniref:GNAT family N-acetyltransferase n=1 Tax=Marinoscillum sp. MHG1-6 TaxID=2959627 RepID=UPI002157C148|nr:GNAT family N-acetyltransferase [Marinoscillum sp. MHG1-6]
MSQSLELKTFSESDIIPLFEAFSLAFSANDVPFRPSLEQFRNRIFRKLGIVNEVSGLLTSGSMVVAFVLHTINRNGNKLTAYNGGTGVIPYYRGNGHAIEVYSWLFPKLQNLGVNNILLEVIDNNQRAIELYKKMGFNFVRTFKCFKLTSTIPNYHVDELIIAEAKQWNSGYAVFDSYETSFLDSIPHLQTSFDNETMLISSIDDQVVGYVIFQSALGRISRLAVMEHFRGKHVASALVREVQKRSFSNEITIMNVPEDQQGTIQALQKMGFVNEVDQIEMELII